MRKLQAIDDNTIYDAPAKTIRLARKMQSGELGKVHSIMIAMKHKDKNGEFKIHTYFYGQETNLGNWKLMVDALEKDLLG